jgi:hypothetical protein
VHIYGVQLIFWYKDAMCKDQIRVPGISITSNIYHFFVLETFRILSSYFEVCSAFLWFQTPPALYNTGPHSSYPTATLSHSPVCPPLFHSLVTTVLLWEQGPGSPKSQHWVTSEDIWSSLPAPVAGISSRKLSAVMVWLWHLVNGNVEMWSR